MDKIENNMWKYQTTIIRYIVYILIGVSLVGTVILQLSESQSGIDFIKSLFMISLAFLILGPIILWFRYNLYKETPMAISLKKERFEIYRKFFRINKKAFEYSDIKSILLKGEIKDYYNEIIIHLRKEAEKDISNFKKRGYGIILRKVDKDLAEKLKKEFEKRR